jgi:DNA-binding response OmpR family regulator
MVVDDEPEILKLIRIAFGIHKYDVVEAESGEVCLAILEKDKDIDLILLDILMPGISGYDVCRKIKADTRFKKIPVVMFSALVHATSIKEGYDCGADEFITKPFDPYLLKERVDGIMGEFKEKI